jgi:hypothetical protein
MGTLRVQNAPRPEPSTRLIHQATAEEGDGEPAAQGSQRRRREILDRRMPTGREMLKVFQHSGVHPKAANDSHFAAVRTIPCHADRCGQGVGYEVFNLAGEPGSHGIQLGQYVQETEPIPRPQ